MPQLWADLIRNVRHWKRAGGVLEEMLEALDLYLDVGVVMGGGERSQSSTDVGLNRPS